MKRPQVSYAFLAAVILLGLTAMPRGAFGQQGLTTGAINGRITDTAGAPLAGATVTIRNTETGASRDIQTDANGSYNAGLLRPGPYNVRAEFPPLEAIEQTVRVSIGDEKVVSIALQPVEVAAIVATIEGERIDVKQGGVVELINEEQIENLPVAGRDFTDFINLDGLVSLQPEIGTGGQFSIGGARTSGTNITIDGADANNAFFGENRGSSRIPFTFSLESIKEFQIVTNGYDVEYGNFTGGVINAVTKGGTNEFRGNAFLYGRDEALTAENFDGTEPQSFASLQFGGTVSGPIIRDELHFFLSGDFQQRDTPVFALDPERAGIPAGAIDTFRMILEDVYGIDTEGDFGLLEETDDQGNIFARIDWAANPNHRLTIRGNYSDFTNKNDRIAQSGDEASTRGGLFEDESFSLVGELNSILGAGGDIYNTFRAQYSTEDRPRPGNSTLPSISVQVRDAEGDIIDEIDYGGSFFGILFANNLEEDKFQITDNLSLQRGNHTFKVGTDNIFSHTENLFWLNGNGFFGDFQSLDDFRNGNTTFFLRFVPQTPPGEDVQPPFAEFDIAEYAFYGQDEWQVNGRLLLNLGLRYDLTDFLDPGEELNDPFGTIINQEFGLSTTTVPEDNNNLSPRVAFTYDVNGDGRQLWRGGAGVFYGRVPAVLHGNVLSKSPRPLLAVTCFGDNTPVFNYGEFQEPNNIPTTCRGGEGASGAPVVTVWDEDFELPTTLKFNLGYEKGFGGYTAGVDVLFSNTWNNFSTQDRNLRDSVFTTADGRPVHIAQADFDPTDTPDLEDRAINPDIDRLFFQTSEAEARAYNLRLGLEGRLRDNLFLGTNYTLNAAFDNSSYSCCTENEGFADSNPTAGNPNFIGDFGDDEEGTWGPSAFERRHAFVTNLIWDLPADFQVGLIYRAQSGNPFTPFVAGDINADGEDENDRPFIADPDNPAGIRFGLVDDGEIIPGSAESEIAEYRAILADKGNKCLQDAIGSIIGRNECRNPWWHRVDVRLNKGFRTFEGQRIELIADLFNVLDAFGLDAGEFVFKENELLQAQGFDPATGEVIYAVNEDYGREIPSGFEPFQFQAQLGIRYEF